MVESWLLVGARRSSVRVELWRSIYNKTIQINTQTYTHNAVHVYTMKVILFASSCQFNAVARTADHRRRRVLLAVQPATHDDERGNQSDDDNDCRGSEECED